MQKIISGLSQESQELLRLKVLMGTVTEKEQAQFTVMMSIHDDINDVTEDDKSKVDRIDDMSLTELFNLVTRLRLENNQDYRPYHRAVHRLQEELSKPIKELQSVEDWSSWNKLVTEDDTVKMQKATNKPLNPINGFGLEKPSDAFYWNTQTVIDGEIIHFTQFVNRLQYQEINVDVQSMVLIDGGTIQRNWGDARDIHSNLLVITTNIGVFLASAHIPELSLGMHKAYINPGRGFFWLGNAKHIDTDKVVKGRGYDTLYNTKQDILQAIEDGIIIDKTTDKRRAQLRDNSIDLKGVPYNRYIR